MRVTCLLVAAMVIGCVGPSAGQVTGSADAPPPAVTPAEDHALMPNEDIEPRVIGAKGRTTLGFAGYADWIDSEDDNLPFHLTLQDGLAARVADGVRHQQRHERQQKKPGEQPHTEPPAPSP